MKTSPRHLLVVLLFLLAVSALPSSLRAQASKIFVASIGNDANDGSRGSPKRNFQAAHDAVAVNGQIVVLDTAGYGALNISKSLAITVPPGVNGFVTVSNPFTGIAINCTSTDTVSLRGLIVEGGGSVGGGTGVFIQDCGRVDIEDCVIRNFDSGLRAPTGGRTFFMARTTIRDCAFGINVSPTTGSFAAASVGEVDYCQIEGCTSAGVLAGADQVNVFVFVNNSTLTKNAVALSARGSTQFSIPASQILVENCRIFNNTTGVSGTTTGTVVSRGNNTLTLNNSGNAFSGSFAAQ